MKSSEESERGLIPGGLKSNHKTNMIIEIKIEKAQLLGRVCQTWSAEVLLMEERRKQGNRGGKMRFDAAADNKTHEECSESVVLSNLGGGVGGGWMGWRKKSKLARSSKALCFNISQ